MKLLRLSKMEVLNLTLTNVVFESMWKCIIPFFVMPDLTLTNVVFE